MSEPITVLSLSERLLEIAEEKKLIKPKDLTAEKISTVYLSRLVKQGKLLQIDKGVGLDAAMETLRDAWRNRLITMDEFWRFAKINRVTKVILSYTQMLIIDQ